MIEDLSRDSYRMEVALLTALGFALIVLLGRLGWVMLKEERIRRSGWALIWMVIALGVCAGPPAVTDRITLSNMIAGDGWLLTLVFGVSLIIAVWGPVHARRRGGSEMLTFALIGVAYSVGFCGWLDAACVGC